MICRYGDWTLDFEGRLFNRSVESLMLDWSECGMKSFVDLDGTWSAVIRNEVGDLVHAVTDFLSTKPLYINTVTGEVGSRIRTLGCVEGPMALDELYFSSIAKHGYHIGDRTFHRDVRKLPPCLYTIYERGEVIEQTTYTELVPHKTDIRARIGEAVDASLVSGRPIAIMASGGLDSAILLGLILERTHDITVFHIDNNERKYFDCLDIPGDVKVQELELEEFDLNEILYHNEGPVDLGSLVPQYQLAAAVKKAGFDIVITGDGADELFGGYHRTARYDSQWSDVFEELVYYHLPRLDKEMSAHGVELRCPFLSRPVIEGALNLPYSQRIGKNYLKELFGDIVPKRIIERKKQALKRPIAEKEEYRLELIRKFREEVVYEYEGR